MEWNENISKINVAIWESCTCKCVRQWMKLRDRTKGYGTLLKCIHSKGNGKVNSKYKKAGNFFLKHRARGANSIT